LFRPLFRPPGLAFTKEPPPLIVRQEDPIFDPLFTIEHPLTEQECTPDPAGHGVMPASHGHIDQFTASDRHGRIAANAWQNKTVVIGLS
jgi:hypothetical protein